MVLVDQGDKVIRSQFKPSEIALPWNGVILSDGEHQRLLEIEADWEINHNVVDTVKLK